MKNYPNHPRITHGLRIVVCSGVLREGKGGSGERRGLECRRAAAKMESLHP